MTIRLIVAEPLDPIPLNLESNAPMEERPHWVQIETANDVWLHAVDYHARRRAGETPDLYVDPHASRPGYAPILAAAQWLASRREPTVLAALRAFGPEHLYCAAGANVLQYDHWRHTVTIPGVAGPLQVLLDSADVNEGTFLDSAGLVAVSWRHNTDRVDGTEIFLQHWRMDDQTLASVPLMTPRHR